MPMLQLSPIVSLATALLHPALALLQHHGSMNSLLGLSVDVSHGIRTGRRGMATGFNQAAPPLGSCARVVGSRKASQGATSHACGQTMASYSFISPIRASFCLMEGMPHPHQVGSSGIWRLAITDANPRPVKFLVLSTRHLVASKPSILNIICLCPWHTASLGPPGHRITDLLPDTPSAWRPGALE